MINALKKALQYMTKLEKFKFLSFLTLRSVVSIFDLGGVLAVGFLAASIALFLSQGSDPERSIELGSISMPAITAQTLPWISTIILSLFIFKAIFSVILTRQLARFLAKIEARASRDIAKRAFSGGLDYVRSNSRDEVLFAVLTGSPSTFNGLLNSLGTLTAEGFLFLIILGSFLVIDPLTASAVLIYFAFIGIIIQHFLGKILEKTSHQINEQAILSSRSLLDLVDVYREATVLGRASFFIRNLYDSRLRASGSVANQIVLLGMPRYIIETSLIIALSLFILLQSTQGDLGTTAATIGVFLSGGLRLTAALLPLQSALLTIKLSVPAANRAFSFLLPEAFKENREMSTPTADEVPKEPSISIRDASYSYPSATGSAVDGISLEVRAGAQVALIGVSGSGKSTIADLILGLIEPEKGQMLIGGVPAKSVLENHPGYLGYVPQRPGMVSGTIAQNIALGVDPEMIDQDQLVKSIEAAQLTEMLKELPDGIYTDLGAYKEGLSGGQLQRIGLARALYNSPQILVMDEATSSLDAESESEINKALDGMRGQVTVVLIAHRLNTIQNSDEVFLVERGSIAASGTFDVLLLKNDTVRNFAKLMEVK